MTSATEALVDPRAEYSRRLAIYREASARHRRRAAWISNLRLLVFVAGIVLTWLALGPEIVAQSWLLVVVGVFAALVVVHDRELRTCRQNERSSEHFEAGIERLDGRWMGKGASGDHFRDGHHPYAKDLDIFGHGSVFEFLCAARTRAGEDTLAAWLRGPAELAVVRSRQVAVAELAPRLDLREELALLGEEVEAGMHPEPLRAWGLDAAEGRIRGLRIAAAVLAAGTVVSGALWLATPVGPAPFLAMLLVQSLFALSQRRRVRRTLAAAEEPGRDLALFSELLARLEAEPVASPHLVALQQKLLTHGQPPSRRIARLRTVLELIDARKNMFFAPIGALLLWTTQLAFEVEAWRAAWGEGLGVWIDAVGEAEALSSLARFAYEHPEYPFPELHEGGARFAGVGLGHPLLPGSQCVTNDVRLGDGRGLFVVSGSNMSGKSTLLRTVGVNAVLALAGAPVAAEQLEISPVSVGASIGVQDSLLEGSSHFYAEITRLRQIMDLCGEERPVLFLIDEILHGTNSHDRGIGAEGVVRGLLARGAMGLVTTHDLALARVAESLDAQAANVHFQDHLEEGAIAFDYRLRPGVVTKSNALELMRAVGLEV